MKRSRERSPKGVFFIATYVLSPAIEEMVIMMTGGLVGRAKSEKDVRGIKTRGLAAAI